MVKCEKCAGRKKISAMGGVKKDCPDCKGAGFIGTVSSEKMTKSRPQLMVKSTIGQTSEKGLNT